MLLNKVKNIVYVQSGNDSAANSDCLFDLVKFIYSFDKLNDPLYSKFFPVYDRLCKKIDVVGKLYTHYSNDLSKKCSDISLTQSQLGKFTSNLVQLARYKHDIKFMNTLLKLLDNPDLNVGEEIRLLVMDCKKEVISCYE